MRRTTTILFFVIFICASYFVYASFNRGRTEDEYEIIRIVTNDSNEESQLFYSVFVYVKNSEPSIEERILIVRDALDKVYDEVGLTDVSQVFTIEVYLVDEMVYDLPIVERSELSNLGEAFLINNEIQFYLDEINYAEARPSKEEYQLYYAYAEYALRERGILLLNDKELMKTYAEAAKLDYEEISLIFQKMERWLKGDF